VFITKIFSQKILKLLSIAFFVITLIFYPSILNSELPFLGSSSVEFSVNAQTVQPERTQEDIKLEIAQASPAPSGSEQASKEKKEVINFFQMAMGAIAGLVLFIYGVTRLAEGLEDIGTDRMKNLLSKFTTNRFAGVPDEKSSEQVHHQPLCRRRDWNCCHYSSGIIISHYHFGDCNGECRRFDICPVPGRGFRF